MKIGENPEKGERGIDVGLRKKEKNGRLGNEWEREDSYMGENRGKGVIRFVIKMIRKKVALSLVLFLSLLISSLAVMNGTALRNQSTSRPCHVC